MPPKPTGARTSYGPILVPAAKVIHAHNYIPMVGHSLVHNRRRRLVGSRVRDKQPAPCPAPRIRLENGVVDDKIAIPLVVRATNGGCENGSSSTLSASRSNFPKMVARAFT